MTDRDAVAEAVATAHREEWALVVAATVRVARDLDLAEDCVQEAYAAALTSWARDGIPRNPAAWLTTTARRRVIDALRSDRAFRDRMPLLIDRERGEGERDAEESVGDRPSAVPDERLRLMFLCCHPALAQEAQVALTLRLVCGVSTIDIAAAFLVPTATMAARITRAKKKIAGAHIPLRVPAAGEIPGRLPAVLGVIHLLFTTGHTAPSGDALVRNDLVDHAVHVCRMLRDLLPGEPEVAGLLALILVTDARRTTRTSPEGRLLRLEEQDRSRWDRTALAEAHDLIVEALGRRSPGRYVLQAAIASVYAEAPSYADTDWPQVLVLYDRLLDAWPTPVVALNRAVPLAQVRGPEAALAEVDALESGGRLADYPYLYAIRADLLVRLGRTTEAAEALRQARELTDNDVERAFLTEQLEALQ